MSMYKKISTVHQQPHQFQRQQSQCQELQVRAAKSPAKSSPPQRLYATDGAVTRNDKVCTTVCSLAGTLWMNDIVLCVAICAAHIQGSKVNGIWRSSQTTCLIATGTQRTVLVFKL